ncbi:autotransporter outer membrane beta-barrel domain-containing protein [Thalassospira sp. HF15]|uniref:autotransporter outer membrane beta-barrel domain-containing protein n=1 Tax=Thalassospira sp. HF15 TaxID=2722755 RepID=UPI001430A9D4|nr:autotransporter outer membrane beta-barrel domain-containing protein [Thalassospira sp. HF15]NIY76748.1 autotransporter outer membrane beta-barrel domain-containing protein [Thalassospira sp. HF15]
MINIVKLPSSLLLVMTIVCGFMIADGRDAFAATTTITCTNLGTKASISYVFYDDSAGTCAAVNGSGSSNDLRDIVFEVDNTNLVDEKFKIGTGSGSSSSAHRGCSMGGFNATAGNPCQSDRSTNTNETATVTIDGENGATIRMTVNYTLPLGGNATFHSASVTITTADSASSGSAAAALRAVQGSVTRSQSVILGQNFGARVANATTGRDLGTVPDTVAPTQQFGFASVGLLDDPMGRKTRTEGTTLSGLAMLASFDTSRVLAAAQTADSPTDGAEQRTLLSRESPITIWGHGSFTDVENTRNRTGEDSRYDGSVWGYNLGADYRFSPALVTGMSVGYAQTDITTTFDSGTYDEDTWNLSPYVIYRPSDMLTFSAIGGYAFGDVARSRNGTVTGNTDSQTWYLQVDARQTFQPIADSPFRVTGGLGALTSRNTLSAYTESDGNRVAESSVNTVQLKPNAELAYAFQISQTSLTPYVKAGYIHDFTDQTNGDAGAFDLGGGVRFASGGTGLSGSIEGTRMVGRDDYREYTLSGLVAYGISFSGRDGNFAGTASPYVGTSLSDSGTPEISAGATLTDIDERFSSKLNFSGDPATRSADILITIDLKF